jgi:hypothetical protein
MGHGSLWKATVYLSSPFSASGIVETYGLRNSSPDTYFEGVGGLYLIILLAH